MVARCIEHPREKSVFTLGKSPHHLLSEKRALVDLRLLPFLYSRLAPNITL